MRANAMDVEFEDVFILNQPMLFTYLRIDRKTVPDNLFMYEVRDDDELQERPTEIANQIIVNFLGTLISKTPVVLTSEVLLNPDTDWGYGGTCSTINEYLNSNQ